MQAYSDPKRESETYALPDIEVWQYTTSEGDDPEECPAHHDAAREEDAHGPDCDGWYWWSCFPGCMPDSDPVGPFATEAEALEDARDGMDDDDTEVANG